MNAQTENKIYTYAEAKEKIAEIYSVIIEAPSKKDYDLKTKKINDISFIILIISLIIILISALISLFIEKTVSQYSMGAFYLAAISLAIEYIFIRFGKNFILKKKYPDWYNGYKLAGYKTQEQFYPEINNIIINTDAVIEERKKHKSANVFINIGFNEQPKVCTAIISAYQDIVDGKAVYTTKELNFYSV